MSGSSCYSSVVSSSSLFSDSSDGPQHSTALSSSYNRSTNTSFLGYRSSSTTSSDELALFLHPLESIISDLHSSTSADSGYSVSLPSFHSSQIDSSAYLNSTFSSSNSSDVGLGPRPECIGQEASPKKKSFTSISLDNANLSSSRLVPAGSSFDSNWDNTQLDATCSTCCNTLAVNNTDSSTVHKVFIQHITDCFICRTGKLCPLGSRMESQVSLVFEVDLHSTVSNDTACFSNEDNFIDDLDCTNNNFYRCESRLTTRSDRTNFMTKPINKSPVTGHRIKRDKKVTLKRKLKSIGKFIRSFGHEALSSQQQTQFETLAVV